MIKLIMINHAFALDVEKIFNTKQCLNVKVDLRWNKQGCISSSKRMWLRQISKQQTMRKRSTAIMVD